MKKLYKKKHTDKVNVKLQKIINHKNDIFCLYVFASPDEQT